MNNKRPSKELLDKVIGDRGTREEIKLVTEYLSSPSSHIDLSHRIDSELEAIEDSAQLDIALGHCVPSDKMLNNIHQNIRRKSMLRSMRRIAAVVLPFFCLLGSLIIIDMFVPIFSAPQYCEIYVPKGQTQRIIMQDGTSVYLNADTHIKFPKRFSLFERSVAISGEAYFEVEKEKMRPFKVQMDNDVAIEVLGTAFNVNAYSSNEEIEVKLERGKIAFTTTAGRYIMEPNDLVIHNKKSNKTLLYNNLIDNKRSMWADDILKFDNVSIESLLSTLERRFDVEFKITDAKLSTLKFNYISKKLPLNEILKELELLAPIQFKSTDNYIEVSLQ